MGPMFYPWDIYCLIEFKHFKMGSMFYPWDICCLIEFKHFKMGSMFYPRRVNLSLGPSFPNCTAQNACGTQTIAFQRQLSVGPGDIQGFQS
jgi:hypothetical protein